MKLIRKRIEALEARRPHIGDDGTWNLRLLSVSELRTLLDLVWKAGADGERGDFSKLAPHEVEELQKLALKAGVNKEWGGR